MPVTNPWVAIDAKTDRRDRANRLARAREVVLSGGRPPAVLRDVIVGSWERCRQAGVDADAAVAPVTDAAAARARWERHPLSVAIAGVRSLLGDAGADGHQVMLFCDVDGTLLWIEGERRELRRAHDAGLRAGAVWSEAAAGTNAMGTALATGHPLQVFSAEHYASGVRDWTCSAAPVHDPETGRCLGVLDLSGELATAHPHSLAVVAAAARLAENELRRIAEESAARLVEAFGERVGTGAGRASALTSPTGRVILTAGEGLAGARVAVPADGGTIALPGGGSAIAEPVPGGGFLLWPTAGRAEGAPPLHLVAIGRDRVRLEGAGAPIDLSPRHSEILVLLALRPQGWTADQLAVELLGDFGKPVTIRSELSRLRRLLGDRISAQPYRLTGGVTSDFAALERLVAQGRVAEALRRCTGELLPASGAPTIAEARYRLSVALRSAVLRSGDPALLHRWLELPCGEDDEDACRELLAVSAPADPRHALALGRLWRLGAGG